LTQRERWRGVTVDSRTARMLDELAAITGSITIRPSQGSWSGAAASAGTHTGCGAVDLMNNTPAEMDLVVDRARSIGFAAWHRTPAQSDWPHHVHLIAIQPGGKHDRGCLASGAHSQVVDYYDGRNGLASRAPDDATRRYVGTTWETYQGKNDMTPEQDAMLREVYTIVKGGDPKKYLNNFDWVRQMVNTDIRWLREQMDDVARWVAAQK